MEKQIKEQKEQLREIAQQCTSLLKKKYKVKVVYLIGSLTHGGIMHKRSDIDLVVEGLPAEHYIKALVDLWDLLPAGVELNLIPFEDAYESLRQKTLTQGEVLYG